MEPFQPTTLKLTALGVKAWLGKRWRKLFQATPGLLMQLKIGLTLCCCHGTSISLEILLILWLIANFACDHHRRSIKLRAFCLPMKRYQPEADSFLPLDISSDSSYVRWWYRCLWSEESGKIPLQTARIILLTHDLCSTGSKKRRWLHNRVMKTFLPLALK